MLGTARHDSVANLDKIEPFPCSQPLRLGPKVLMLETREPIGSLLTSYLEKQGFFVLHAASPDEAFALWLQHKKQIGVFLACIPEESDSPARSMARIFKKGKPQIKVINTACFTDFAPDRKLAAQGRNVVRSPYPPQLLARLISVCLSASPAVV